jgi:pyruvate dehydrogenase E1 component alpha subunit
MTQAPTANTRMAKAHSSTNLVADLPVTTQLKWLRDMQLIREFENRTMQAYQQAKIGGFCHIYSGQEACAVGTIGCTNQDDPVVTAYRDHGHALAKGMSARACMAEMFGKLHGCAKGKGGSMHMFDRPNWLFGGHGIVGAQTPLGAGLAFAAKYENEVLKRGVHPHHEARKKVTLCYLGDGAIDQGAFHEALNLASLMDLPVIFIIENNGYSMGTAIHRHTANHDNLISRGESYGIDSIKIDGLDIRNVYNTFKPFVDHCRANSRPGFVDFKTYRYQGHSMSDPQKYRTKEEVEEYKNKDSIARLLGQLMDEGHVTEDAWKDMQNEIRDEVLDSVEFAENSPAPTPEAELFSDVYALPQKNLSPTAQYHHGFKNPLL